MGNGDSPFAKFGHAAMCVFDELDPEGVCFNYGTSDFTHPVRLGWGVLRGRATFWVSTSRADRMIAAYRREDRTLWRQALPLAPASAAGLARALRADLAPDRRNYDYLFFGDNCSTRLRDHLDRATGGLLRLGADEPLSETYRDRVRRAFASAPGLLVASELFLGRVADRQPTIWEAMFLPEVLREEVSRRLGVAAEVIYQRRGPAPAGDPSTGMRLLTWLALALALLTAAAHAPRRRSLRRAALVLSGVTLGLLAAGVDFLAIASTLPELTHNELLLVLLPTDLLLVFLDGRRLRVYLVARLGLLLVVSLAGALGLLAQPLLAPVALVAGALAPALAFEVYAARRGVTTAAERPLLDSASGGEPR
jgi:hypothetical protein